MAHRRILLVFVVVLSLLAGILPPLTPPARAATAKAAAASAPLPAGQVTAKDAAAPPTVPPTQPPGAGAQSAVTKRVMANITARSKPPVRAAGPAASGALARNVAALAAAKAHGLVKPPAKLTHPLKEKAVPLAELPHASAAGASASPNPSAGAARRPDTITPHTGYGATYSLAGGFAVQPMYSSPGYMYVTVTNTSGSTWAANTIAMGYHLYYSNGADYNFIGVSTEITVAVTPGESVDVYSALQQLGVGTYEVVWDLIDLTQPAGSNYFSDHGVPASKAYEFTVPHYPPSGEFWGPADGATLATTAPSLEVIVQADGSEANQTEFQVCTTADPANGTCWNSGWQPVAWTQGDFSATSVWNVPISTLFWDKTYYWEFRVEDTGSTTPWSSSSSFTPVPTPPTYSQLGEDGQTDSAGVGMFLGNYTASATDLTLTAPGISIPITRYYNSLNTGYGVFGQGWSSIFDMQRTVDSAGTVTVTFPDGRQVAYGANPDGTYTAAAGETSEGRLTDQNTLVMTGGDVYKFFPGTGKILSITPAADQNSEVVFNRDLDDNVGEMSVGSFQVNLGYTPYGAGEVLTSIQEVGASAPWTYAYSGWQLTKACDPRTDLVSCTQYTYTSSTGPLSTIEKPDGASETTTITYASDGTVASVQMPSSDPGTWTYARIAPYDANAALTVHVTDPRKTNVYYEFDAEGRLWSRWLTDPTPTAGLSSEWAYGPTGQVVGTVDENGNGAEYIWDPDGWLDTYDVPRDAKNTAYTNWQHDLFAGSTPLAQTDPRYGEVTEIIDANDHTTTMTYNSNGEIATSTAPPTKASPSGATTTYKYTCDGGAASPPVVNDPGAPAGALEDCGLLASVTDPDGHVTSYGYDDLGDQARIVTPTGETTNIFHNALGEVTSRTVIDSTYPNGATTTFTYDPDGRVATETDPAVTNPITGVTHQLVTTNSYDADGNLIKVVQSDATAQSAGGNAPRTTTYTYDSLGDKTSTAVNGTVTSTAWFNAFGQQVRSADGLYNPHVLQSPSYYYNYNAVGDLTSITMPDFVDYSTTPPTTRTVVLDQYTYDPAGRLSSYTDSLGHTVSYTYTLDNLKAGESYLNYTSTLGGAVSTLPLHQYTYDLAGNLLQDTAGTGTTARTTVNTYDNDNTTLTSTEDPSGLNRETSYVYDPTGALLSTTLSNGTQTQTTENGYSSTGQLDQSEVLNNATPNLVTTYARDSAGLVLGDTAPLGSNAFGSSAAPNAAYTTTSTFDLLGRLSTTSLPPVSTEDGTGAPAVTQSPTTTKGYDVFGDVTDVKDPDGNVTHYDYDAFGRVTEIDHPTATEPDGAVISPFEKYTYDNNGNVTSYLNTLGQTTTYAYDARNRPYLVTLPPATSGASAGVEHMAWDDGGNLLSVIDPTGAQTLYVYDSNERLAQKTSVVRNGTSTPAEYTTQYKYDQFGDLINEETPGLANISATYDNAGEVATATQTNRGTTSYGYDVAGNLISTTDPLNRKTVTSYDEAGRPTGTTNYSATGAVVTTGSMTTDPDGDVTAVKDADQNTWSATYNADGLLTARIDPPTPSAPNGATTTFGYDADGQQTRTTDADQNATLQTYDALGDPVTEELPATTAASSSTDRISTTSYNTAGDPVATTQPGDVTTAATYDGLGRLTSLTGSGAGAPTTTKTFGYDLDGRLTSYSSPTYGTVTLGYDDRGLLQSQSVPAAGGLPATTYSASYDSSGRLASQTDSSGTTSYTYSGVDDLASATSSLTGATYGYSYDNAGELTGEKDSTAGVAGPSYTVAYDSAGDPTMLSAYTSSGAANGSLNYSYDANGNVLSKAGTGVYGSEGSQSYTYDAANRLTSTTTATDTQTYSWDPVGNRLSTTDKTASGTTTTSTTYDQRDEPLTATSPTGTTSYAWSPRGTLSSITSTPTGGPAATTDATFDAFDRLTSLGSSDYTYDALDQLEQTGGSGGTSAGNLAQYAPGELEPSGVGGWNLARTPGQDGDILSGKSSASGASPESIIEDLHGDTVSAVNPSSGAVQASQSFGPFGQPAGSTGGANAMPPTGFQGDYTDSSTGMVYAESRWYDPTLGDFLSPDTAPPGTTTALDTNLYAYADDNPTSENDPTGHAGCGILAAVCDTVEQTWDEITSGLGDVAAIGDQAIAEAEGFGAGLAEGAVEGLEVAGIAVAEDAVGAVACVIGCAELLAGALIVVAVAGIMYELTVNADGSTTYDGVYTPPSTNASPSVGSSPQTGSQTNTPPAPPPVTIVGQTLTTTSHSWTKVSKWYDSTYLYTRTDTYTQTTDTLTTYFSDGSEKWISSSNITDAWRVVAQLLIDLSNPVVLPTPKPGAPVKPGPNQDIAVGTSLATCGSGGSMIACAQAGSTPLPPGALGTNGNDGTQTDSVTNTTAVLIPPGYYLNANGDYVDAETGEVFCGPGNSGGCTPISDPAHPLHESPSCGSGSVDPGAMDEVELDQAWAFVGQFGGQFIGQAVFNQAGIDGSYEGIPISFKAISPDVTNPTGALVTNIGRAARDAQKAGESGVWLVVRALGMTQAQAVDVNKISSVMLTGVITRVSIETSTGWVHCFGTSGAGQ